MLDLAMLMGYTLADMLFALRLFGFGISGIWAAAILIAALGVSFLLQLLRGLFHRGNAARTPLGA